MRDPLATCTSASGAQRRPSICHMCSPMRATKGSASGAAKTMMIIPTRI